MMNRRSFLRGSGAALLGVATLGLLGKQAEQLLSATHNGAVVYGHPNGTLLYDDPVWQHGLEEMAKQARKAREEVILQMVSKTS